MLMTKSCHMQGKDNSVRLLTYFPTLWAIYKPDVTPPNNN